MCVQPAPNAAPFPTHLLFQGFTARIKANFCPPGLSFLKKRIHIRSDIGKKYNIAKSECRLIGFLHLLFYSEDIKL
jgi:hypothetical protein